MRLVSYNILDGGTGRADPIAEILLARTPDIVCLVESQDPSVVERIAARLEMDHFRAGDERQSATILSRFPIRRTIDHAALRPSRISKALLEAVVTVPDGTDLPIGVLHLHAGAFEPDETRREAELAAVLDVFAQYRKDNRPHLLAGDFNSNAPDQQIEPDRCKRATREAWTANGSQVPRRVVQKLRDAGYIDTLAAYDPSQARSAASFTTLHPGQRVDYVFAFGIDPQRIRSAWIEHDRLATYASDHYPVGVEIS